MVGLFHFSNGLSPGKLFLTFSNSVVCFGLGGRLMRAEPHASSLALGWSTLGIGIKLAAFPNPMVAQSLPSLPEGLTQHPLHRP